LIYPNKNNDPISFKSVQSVRITNPQTDNIHNELSTS
jgi:hypothetical protein